MEPISAWTATAYNDLGAGTTLLEKVRTNYTLKIIATRTALWIAVYRPKGGDVAFRAVFTANDELTIKELDDKPQVTTIGLTGTTGSYTVTLRFPESEGDIFNYTTKFTPAFDMLIPYWPRDIMPLVKTGKVQNTAATVHVRQVGRRSGNLFFSQTRPVGGAVFYFQDLTSLNGYCQATETSAGDLVGGDWPEVGFKLPVTVKKPLPAGQQYTISDAYVIISDDIPKDNFEITQQYVNHLATVYMQLQKPQTVYHNWLDMLHKGLDGLDTHKGCWSFADGRSYLNAYVSDYKTPPESMVQLAVLLPLVDFDRWSGENHNPIIDTLKEGIANFYDKKLGTVTRWLPALEGELDGSEEQITPDVMDAWYLHHPLMNLSRLALHGDEEAKKLLLDSVDYVIKVAHHFDYEWPVFYKMSTLEVIKAETSEGQGGEKDVPGAYAHLMIQVWQLTGEKRYLNEAKRAAKHLQGLAFDLFYQANNTSFTAGGMLRLYKETGDALYLNLSYVCIAAILKNTQLWECNYGYGKHISTFFGVYPLKDAPYTAAYEEQEVFAGVHNYLHEAQGIEILPAVRLLLSEFVKYALHRLPFYYPPMLPQEMLSKEVKTGEIDPNLWVALEDLQDGWEESGTVGQEVYGAGVAFGIVPRQYFKAEEHGYLLFTNYPAHIHKRGGAVFLTFYGDAALQAKIILIKDENKKLSVNLVAGEGKNAMPVKPSSVTKEHIEYNVPGNSFIKISH
jgi:hypothetical protein